MKIYSLFLFSFALVLTSCANIKPISKGKLSENKSYDFSYFVYEDVNAKNHGHAVKSCKIFISQIKDKDQRVREKIIYYSCSSLAPLKILYNTDKTGKGSGQEYFIGVTDNDFVSPTTEDEAKQLLMMDDHKTKGDYPHYAGIKGFRVPALKDSLEKLPFLKSVEKNHKR